MDDEVKGILKAMVLLISSLVVLTLAVQVVVSFLDLYFLKQKLLILQDVGLDAELIKEIAKLIGGS